LWENLEECHERSNHCNKDESGDLGSGSSHILNSEDFLVVGEDLVDERLLSFHILERNGAGGGGGGGDAGVRSGARGAARGHGGIEVEALLQPGELVSVGLGAELAGGDVILYTKHCLTLAGESLEVVALVVLEALLVDGEIEVGSESRNLVDVVLESNAEVEGVGRGGEEVVEVELVVGGEGESGVVLVRINVVHLHGVATLGSRLRDAARQDAAHDGRADIDPLLAWPPVDSLSEDGGGEGGGVEAAGLVGGVDVADDGAAGVVEGRDERGRGTLLNFPTIGRVTYQK